MKIMEIYAPVKSKAKESIMEEITPKSLKNELKIFEIIDNRNFDCNYYTKCLNYAAGMNWKSFTCNGCKYWGNLKTNKKELRKNGKESLKHLLLLKHILSAT